MNATSFLESIFDYMIIAMILNLFDNIFTVNPAFGATLWRSTFWTVKETAHTIFDQAVTQIQSGINMYAMLVKQSSYRSTYIGWGIDFPYELSFFTYASVRIEVFQKLIDDSLLIFWSGLSGSIFATGRCSWCWTGAARGGGGWFFGYSVLTIWTWIKFFIARKTWRGTHFERASIVTETVD